MAAMKVHGVSLTSPDKALADGVTKRDLAEHYARVAERALPHLADRPITLVRCPDGLDGGCFFQKHAQRGAPDALGRVTVEERDGPAEYLYVDDAAGLVALAQLAALEVHVPWARRDRQDRRDRLVFDRDPGPGGAFADGVAAAREVRDRLDADGLRSFPLLTGGSGIHVVVPLARRHAPDAVRGFAKATAARMTEDAPDRYVATVDKDARAGRVFVDYLRNGPGATAIAPYSPRAKSQLPVAVPIRWDELGRVEASAAYPLVALPRRLGALKGDPWDDWRELRQRLPS